MKPRVLLFQPPIYDFGLFDLFFKPYGLLRLGRWFADTGYEISYLNAMDWTDPATIAAQGPVKRRANGTGKFFRKPAKLPSGVPQIPKQYSRYGICVESIAESIKVADPHIVMITTGMTYWYEGVVEAVAAVRTHAPTAKIVLGGIYASLMPEHALNVTGADAVVTGDGEDQLRGVLESFSLTTPESSIPHWPILIPAAWKGIAGAIRLNTGCPLHCDYCASDQISPNFIQGNAESSFGFLSTLRERFGITHIGFYDDALLMRKEEVLIPFLERILASEQDWKFYTPNAVHVRLIDKRIASLLYRSGFQEIRMGYESASSVFHDEHDHKFTTDDFGGAVEALYSAGFTKRQLPVYVLAGLPGQHRSEVAHSIEMASKAGVAVSIAEYSPIPGTSSWDETIASCGYPLEEEPLLHNNSLHITQWDGLTRDDMQELKLAARATR